MKPDIQSLIIHEDDQLIVIHKPAGLATQSARIGSQDMVSLLKNYLVKSTKTKGKEPYLAVIHRLDQPVEGLLVFAKTPAAAKGLNEQLTTSGFGKYYLATVHGIPTPEEGTLTDYLIKDARTNSSKVCEKSTPGCKIAKLHYRTLQCFEDSAQLEIHLDTGRHHQIRVQMAHSGHPLIGDRKYGSEYDTDADRDHLHLCAYRLTFKHPKTGKEMEFQL